MPKYISLSAPPQLGPSGAFLFYSPELNVVITQTDFRVSYGATPHQCSFGICRLILFPTTFSERTHK